MHGSSQKHEVPSEPPEDSNELRIDGLSLLFYHFYLLDKPTANADLRPMGLEIEAIRCDHHYNTLFNFNDDELKRHEVYRYTKPLEIFPMELQNAGCANGAATLCFQSVGRFLLTSTIINVDLNGDTIHHRHLNVGRSLTVSDIYDIIKNLNHPGPHFDRLEAQREQAISDCFGHYSIPSFANQSRSILAMQVWDIANLTLTPRKKVDGVKLCFSYGWEVSALLEANCDVIWHKEGWKRNRRRDQVTKHFENASDVLADHRVLRNRSVVLEICQVNHPEIGVRSAQRLASFGYDSTSVFLWGHLALEEFVLEFYSKELSVMLSNSNQVLSSMSANADRVYSRDDTSRAILLDLLKVKTDIYYALDNVSWITEDMIEDRHVTFFRSSNRDRGFDELIGVIERKLGELSSISTDMNQVLLLADQRNTLHDLHSLTQATARAKRSIDIFFFVMTAAQATILSDYFTSLIPALHTPAWKSAIALALFGLAILMFAVITGRNPRPKS